MSEYRTTDELLDDSRSLREIIELGGAYSEFMDNLIEEQKESAYRRPLLIATLSELESAYQNLVDITHKTVCSLKLLEGGPANV